MNTFKWSAKYPARPRLPAGSPPLCEHGWYWEDGSAKPGHLREFPSHTATWQYLNEDFVDIVEMRLPGFARYACDEHLHFYLAPASAFSATLDALRAL